MGTGSGHARRAAPSLVAAGAVTVLLLDVLVLVTTPEPVAVEAVVERFREESAGALADAAPGAAAVPRTTTTPAPGPVEAAPAPTAAEPVEPPDPGPSPDGPSPAVPEPGVYVYDTVGEESIDVPGGGRRYPETTTITYRTDGCGPLVRWDVLEERWDEHRYCLEGDGWRLESATTHHSFFEQGQTDSLTCADHWLVPPGARPGTVWTGTCTDGDTSTETRGEVIGWEPVAVAGRTLAGLRVRTVTALSGGGERVTERWLAEGSRLVLRASGTTDVPVDGPFGPMRYRERYELRLRDPAPRR